MIIYIYKKKLFYFLIGVFFIIISLLTYFINSYNNKIIKEKDKNYRLIKVYNKTSIYLSSKELLNLIEKLEKNFDKTTFTTLDKQRLIKISNNLLKNNIDVFLLNEKIYNKTETKEKNKYINNEDNSYNATVSSPETPETKNTYNNNVNNNIINEEIDKNINLNGGYNNEDITLQKNIQNENIYKLILYNKDILYLYKNLYILSSKNNLKFENIKILKNGLIIDLRLNNDIEKFLKSLKKDLFKQKEKLLSIIKELEQGHQ